MEELWQEHYKELRNFILSKVNNIHDAEDLLQDVFLKYYQNKDSFKGESSVKTWLYSITRNTVIDHYRKKKDLLVTTEKLTQLVDKGYNIELENDNCNAEVSDYLKILSREMPVKYQDVFELREQKNMKHKDIAEALGISVSASKVRHMRAKTMLKEVVKTACQLESDIYGNITDCNYKDLQAQICC